MFIRSLIIHFGTPQCRNWARGTPICARFSCYLNVKKLLDHFSDIIPKSINRDRTRGNGTVCIYENRMLIIGDVEKPSLVQNSGFQLHIAGLVHSMHVAECCSNGEKAIFHFAQRIVNLKDLLKGKATIGK